MRHLIFATGIALVVPACESGPGELADPPVLLVTSPMRSLIQDHAGAITVTGTVTPSDKGAPVKSVMVNNVPAVVAADGSFNAIITVPEGASLIQTVATGKDGGTATDTRSVEAGQLRAPGSNIENALTAALSANAFAKLGDAAGNLIATTDLRPMLAPLQPMVHSGDENGPDCLYGELFVNNVTMSAAKITLVPVAGGLSFQAELDNVDVPGHMSYAVACLGGDDTTDISATQVIIGGTLLVTPNGMMGFDTQLTNATVNLSGLNISSSGVPGAILDIVPLDSAIEYIAPKVAGMFMGPMVNQALGALAGPQKLTVMGKTIDMQVSPSDISFDPTGGLVVLNTSIVIEGAENSKGFTYTDNGMPAMDPGNGLMIGIADDMANEMLSQFVALGMLNLSMPSPGGTFDTVALAMTSPPMISASPSDGKMQLVLPDVMATFTNQGTPVAKAALNAMIDLKIVPAGNGAAISIQLGAPTIAVDVLPDVPNTTSLTNADLGTGAKAALDSQIQAMSALLGVIPLPQVAGIQMKNLSITGDDGYVMVKSDIQ